MSASIVRTVREETDSRCHTNTCREGRCALRLDGMPEPSVLISLEHEAAPVEADQPRCDYLFVGGNDRDAGTWVAPIELTARKAGFSKFRRQLIAGAAIADRLLPRHIKAIKFRPVAVHAGIHRNEVNKFRNSRNKIRFRDESVPIELTRCGSPLTKSLNG